jgi:ubiquinone/menaquinone biosynthesis C-methylase UbiE
MMSIFNYETLIDPILKDLRKAIPEFSGMRAGDKVIDVCCGTGAQVLEYGRRGITADGIDNSRDMLKTATRNRLRQQVNNVSFVLADAAKLPFPDDYFDYATISLALHDKARPKRYQIISEMKRVVKTAGSLILIDFQVPLPGNVLAQVARSVEFLAGGSHYQGFKDFLATGGLEDILENHGLQLKSRICLKGGLFTVAKAVNA